MLTLFPLFFVLHYVFMSMIIKQLDIGQNLTNPPSYMSLLYLETCESPPYGDGAEFSLSLTSYIMPHPFPHLFEVFWLHIWTRARLTIAQPRQMDPGHVHWCSSCTFYKGRESHCTCAAYLQVRVGGRDSDIKIIRGFPHTHHRQWRRFDPRVLSVFRGKMQKRERSEQGGRSVKLSSGSGEGAEPWSFIWSATARALPI